MTTVDRPRLIARISQSLCTKGYPRIQITFIVAATGLAGFLASVFMLHCGVGKMWQRYPLAVIVSYGVFLLPSFLAAHLGLDTAISDFAVIFDIVPDGCNPFSQ
jgi:hypothetical protein